MGVYSRRAFNQVNTVYGCICTPCAVPAPRCDSAVSNNGAITITWSLLHTGGLPLSSLTISYTYTEGLNVVQGGQPEMVSSDETSHPFPGLITGFVYTFSVTAVNAKGSACGCVYSSRPSDWWVIICVSVIFAVI